MEDADGDIGADGDHKPTASIEDAVFGVLYTLSKEKEDESMARVTSFDFELILGRTSKCGATRGAGVHGGEIHG